MCSKLLKLPSSQVEIQSAVPAKLAIILFRYVPEPLENDVSSALFTYIHYTLYISHKGSCWNSTNEFWCSQIIMIFSSFIKHAYLYITVTFTGSLIFFSECICLVLLLEKHHTELYNCLQQSYHDFIFWLTVFFFRDVEKSVERGENHYKSQW